MGAGLKNLVRLAEFCEHGWLPPGARVVELGTQELYASEYWDSLRKVIDVFAKKNPAVRSGASFSEAELKALADRGFLSATLIACGLEYQALDIFEAPYTRLFDLNTDRPDESLRGRFDLVTNFGTTEHLLGQQQAFTTMHDLAKPGGLLYHELPLSGYHQHGYFSYNPLLFREIARANAYEVVAITLSKNDHLTPTSQHMRDSGFSESGYFDRGIECILRKTVDAPFRVPLETSTSLDVSCNFMPGVYDQAGGTNAIGSRNLSYDLSGLPTEALVRETALRLGHRGPRWLGRKIKKIAKSVVRS